VYAVYSAFTLTSGHAFDVDIKRSLLGYCTLSVESSRVYCGEVAVDISMPS